MDYAQLPVGFAMTLAQNEVALNAYAAMDEKSKQAVVERALRAGSQREMQQIVYTLANSPM